MMEKEAWSNLASGEKIVQSFNKRTERNKNITDCVKWKTIVVGEVEEI